MKISFSGCGLDYKSAYLNVGGFGSSMCDWRLVLHSLTFLAMMKYFPKLKTYLKNCFLKETKLVWLGSSLKINLSDCGLVLGAARVIGVGFKSNL